MGLCRQRRKKMLRVTFDHWSKENKRVVQLLKTHAEIGWKKKKMLSHDDLFFFLFILSRRTDADTWMQSHFPFFYKECRHLCSEFNGGLLGDDG